MRIRTKLWINGFVFLAIALWMIAWSLGSGYHPEFDIEIWWTP